ELGLDTAADPGRMHVPLLHPRSSADWETFSRTFGQGHETCAVDLAAPRPFAIVASEKDFFRLAGAKWTFAEAQRVYAPYRMENTLGLIHGQGGHCNLGPVPDQLRAFLMSNHFFGEKIDAGRFQRLRPANLERLTVTPTSQVSTSLNSLTAE